MNNSLRTILFFVLAFVSMDGYGQSVIRGQITDRSGNAVDGASVRLIDPANNLLIDYTFSDVLGIYAFSYSGQTDSLSIEVAGFNIGTNLKTVINTTQTVNFTVNQEAFDIREVTVLGQKLWGVNDTVNYSVGAYVSENDVVIGDVLQKLPGVTVTESGEIEYRGRAINKFYIEGLDLLQGRYGIATNNIPVRNIATVQVLENHQPIRALEGVSPSDQAAINLKLRAGVRGVFTLMGMLGGGAVPDAESTPLLWENTLTAMYFTRLSQNISLYKGNNTGYDVAGELRSFTARDYFGNDDLLTVRIPSPPSIQLKRYLFNSVHAGSFNNLWLNKHKDVITVNTTYLNDHQHRTGRSRTEYFLPGGQVQVLDELIASTRTIQRIEGGVRYNSNRSERYLNSDLIVVGEWNRELGHVETEQRIPQRLTDPAFAVIDQFDLIKNNDGKGYEFHSSLGFRNAPQSLTVLNGAYPETFNGGENYSALRQQQTIRKGYWNASGSLLSIFSIMGIRVDPKASLNVEYHSLDSKLFSQTIDSNFMPIQDATMRNDLGWLHAGGSLGLGLRYEYRVLQINVDLPVIYNYLHLDDAVNSAAREDYRLLLFQPDLQWSIQPSSEMKFSGRIGINNTIGTIRSLYTGYILQDYHNLNRFDDLLPRTRNLSGTLSAEYRSLINMLFANAEASWSYKGNNTLIEQFIDGLLVVTSRIRQHNVGENFNLQGTFSKGFDLMNTMLSLEVNWGMFSSRQLRQSVLVDFDNTEIDGKITLNVRPLRGINFVYTGAWGRISSRMNDEVAFDPIRSQVNTLTFDATLFRRFGLNAAYETYYNSAAQGEKTLSFTDLGVEYRRKNTSLSLAWNNIFNTQRFLTAWYGDINAYQSVYDIRPSALLLRFRIKML